MRRRPNFITLAALALLGPTMVPDHVKRYATRSLTDGVAAITAAEQKRQRRQAKRRARLTTSTLGGNNGGGRT